MFYLQSFHDVFFTKNILLNQGKDIALIIIRSDRDTETNKILHYTDSDIATIPEMSSDEVCCDDEDVLQAIGYGLDDDLEDPTNTLEWIELEYHPSGECGMMINQFYGKNSYNPGRAKDIICASGDGVEVDTCQGDSVCTFTKCPFIYSM